jgi:uncharacterized protein
VTPPPLPPILPKGTQVVTRVAARRGGGEVPAGAVGVVERAPADTTHAYRVRFPDGSEAAFRRHELRVLKHFNAEGLDAETHPGDDFAALEPFVAYRCVVGSRAYGLAVESSDTDRRGFYLPPAELHWSLFGAPAQIEREGTQEAYWELGRFLRFALKANPNVLEALWSPLVEHAAPVAEELLAIREAFLSRLVFQTYNGYALSQFRKIEQDVRARGDVKWKHAMHLVRLLLAGSAVLREGTVRVDVGEHREALLAVRRGAMAWAEVDAWRRALHADFERAYAATRLPERPDYVRVNDFLVRARRSAVR